MTLRDRLAELAATRIRLERELQDVRRATGQALLGVRDDDELNLTKAAGILGVSRMTVYCLLEDAEASG
jgi:predicted transcriptional regulator